MILFYVWAVPPHADDTFIVMTGPLFEKTLVRVELGVAVIVWIIEDLDFTVSLGKKVAAFMTISLRRLFGWGGG